MGMAPKTSTMKMNIRNTCIVAGILLVLAIPTGWPYGYYILLRWIISIIAAIVAYEFYKSHLQAWTFVFGSITFLFNPIIPVYLSKSTWVLIDLIAAILFFVAAYS